MTAYIQQSMLSRFQGESGRVNLLEAIKRQTLVGGDESIGSAIIEKVLLGN